MSWRVQKMMQQTGSNSMPLGKRRFGGGERDDGDDQDESFVAVDPPIGERVENGDRGRRIRRSRFGEGTKADNKALGLMNLPTIVNTVLTAEQLEAYALHLRIEEIGQKLRIEDLVPRDKARSPSPPPTYDNMGRRTNTREIRYRKKLEDERHKLVEKAMRTIPDYKPPSDYRRPNKTQEKIYVPVNDYPEINFIGLLIGPRGNTLKKMEADSGAKIAIRGKGSVKEGKGRNESSVTMNNIEEDLHCLVSADTEEKVKMAIKLIEHVIETAASIPEGQNELKRNQLRELATLNGTLRDDENQVCQNCGGIGHRKYDCPQVQNPTVNIICRRCGFAGHMARDCKEKIGSGANAGPLGGGSAVDREYQNLLLELEGGPTDGSVAGAIEGTMDRKMDGHAADPALEGLTPWRLAQRQNYPWAKPLGQTGSQSQSTPSIPTAPGTSAPGTSTPGVNNGAGSLPPPPSVSYTSLPPPPSLPKQYQQAASTHGYSPPGGKFSGHSSTAAIYPEASGNHDYSLTQPPPLHPSARSAGALAPPPPPRGPGAAIPPPPPPPFAGSEAVAPPPPPPVDLETAVPPPPPSPPSSAVPPPPPSP